MDYRRRLFTYPEPYDHSSTDSIFLEAIRSNAAHHIKHCPEYAAICREENFAPASLRTMEDLQHLPVLPTLFLKTHPLSSLEGRKAGVQVSSSGTGGVQTRIPYDSRSLYWGLRMVLRLTAYHKLRSLRPVNYLVMGYKPSRDNPVAASKTAFGATLFAPALHRTYALRRVDTGIQVNMNEMKKALLHYARSPFPVRFMGFPAYTWFFLQELKKDGICLRLHSHSRIMLGGGWKQFYREQVDKEAFYALVEEILGLPDSRCSEFFGAVEHPVLYCDCPRHHFHLPIYSRVLIRDVKTLTPVPNGTPGLVDLLTPMVESAPLTSVMTDDLGILHDGRECGCGISSPWLEIIGRVGMPDIKTCAAGAATLLQGALAEKEVQP